MDGFGVVVVVVVVVVVGGMVEVPIRMSNKFSFILSLLLFFAFPKKLFKEFIEKTGGSL